MVRIFVQRMEPDGERFELEVELHHTIKWIKALLMEKTNEQLSLQHLFYNGKELDDHLELRECSLYRDDSTLHLVVDADPMCALISKVGNLNLILKDMSKAKLFKRI